MGKLNILIVEDNPADAMLAARYLERATSVRFVAARAGTVADACRAAESAPCDAILLDLNLPDAHGLDGYAKLRKCAPGAPIIILSGNEDTHVAKAAVTAGAQDFLLKGKISTEILERSIHYAIERQKLSQALVEARFAAEAANQAKSSFLAVMSHEFRTPLNGIIGSLAILRFCQDPKERETIIAIAEDCAATHLELVNDILDLSKIESNKLQLESTDCSIREIARTAVSTIQLKAQSKNIELRTTVDPAIPRTLSTDPKRLRQVLINLLSNAVKFTDAGRIVLDIQQADPQTIRFQVSDTGIGISEEKQQTIFEAFTQADSTTTRKYGGTGLGLAICRKMVGLFGGEMSVRSEEGAGAVFSFTLPIVIRKEIGINRLSAAPDAKRGHNYLLN